ncbi:MAG: hypothetical protein ABMA64_00070 [Myxococcota bacterium]
MNRYAITILLTLAGCPSERNLFEQVKTDVWAQAPTNLVDILWVIDDSASMTEEQNVLVNGFASFASEVDTSGTDFHLGVITTSFDYADPARASLRGDPPFLTPADDYQALFPERALVGIGGEDKEKGLEAAVWALQPTLNLPGAPNDGFVRKDAQLLTVFVSDEEDCSDEGALEGQPPEACYQQMDELPPVDGFVDALRDLKPGDRGAVQVAAIVGTSRSTCPDVYTGNRYVQAAGLTGGLVGDICQSDWSQMLGDLGLNATGIRTQFQLSYAAQPDTLEVYVDDEKVPGDPVNGWTYDEPSWYLEFHGDAIPPRGSAVSATYTVQPGAPSPVVTSSAR